MFLLNSRAKYLPNSLIKYININTIKTLQNIAYINLNNTNLNIIISINLTKQNIPLKYIMYKIILTLKNYYNVIKMAAFKPTHIFELAYNKSIKQSLSFVI